MCVNSSPPHHLAHRRRPALLLTVLVALGWAEPAHAVLRIWDPVGFSFDWHTAANWDPTGVPTTNDDVRIGGAGLTTFSADTAPVNSLLMTGGAMQTNGHTLNVDNGSNSATLGFDGGGTIALFPKTGGGNALRADRIALGGGGTLNLSGDGVVAVVDNVMSIEGGTLRGSSLGSKSLTFSASASLPTPLVNDGTISLSGGGLFTIAPTTGANFDLDGITEAGVIEVTSGELRTEASLTDAFDGTATVSGTDASWVLSSFLDLGGEDNGTMTISDGGSVESERASIGKSLSATVTVADAGSSWTNGSELNVGDASTGTLAIEAGGNVSNTAGTIGVLSGSTGTVNVTGPGSNWTNTSNLFVGESGHGTLLIEAGGSVVSAASASQFRGVIGDASDSTGMVTVTGAASTWTNGGELFVGNFGTGELTIADGGSVSNAGLGLIAVELGSTGTVTVTGAGSTWTSPADLTVASGGLGMLMIEAGGSVSNAQGFIGAAINSAGSVTVTGLDSTWTNSQQLLVGASGIGTLTISDGGSVSNTDGIVGDNLFLNSVTVTGAGSTWNNSSFLVIGREGLGELTIEAGGSVSNNSANIATQSNSGGTVTVTGEDSIWDNSGPLVIAVNANATGQMLISDRGRVENTFSIIGSFATGAGPSSGTVTVTGDGSIWENHGQLTVGDLGMGTLSIEAGGSVSNTDAFIGRSSGSTGAVTVSGIGSNWTITGQLSVGGNAAVGTNGGTGTLNINPSASVSAAGDTVLFPDGLLNLQGGTFSTAAVSFEGDGQFDWTSGTLHVGTFDGNLVNQGGTLAPGNSAGSTDVVGEYTQQAGAALAIEIGGLTPGTDFDVLSVGGTATLAGTLEVSLIGGFATQVGQQFTVVIASELFDEGLSLGGAAASLFDLVVDSSSVTLEAIAASLAGDVNLDGIVDTADYVLWRKNDGSPAGYNTWRANYGTTTGSGSALGPQSRTAVPEPQSAFVCLVGGVLLAIRRGGWYNRLSVSAARRGESLAVEGGFSCLSEAHAANRPR